MQTPKPIHLLAALLACSLGGAARAAEINGTVRNAQTGAFLEAVEVTVLDRGITTRTDREGRFSVPNLPAGEHRVRIAYPGSAEEVVTVNLADAVSTRSIDSALRPADDDRSVVQLGAFVVASEREGYSASVARQKAADNLQNILSMDTYGTVADGNIGNFVQRLAGVSAIKDIDIVGVSLRGTPGGATAITMDGSRFAGVEGDRSSRIDQIPSEFIKEIEVIKGNTPDMWADGLAGTINLVTKSAFQFKDDVRTLQGGAHTLGFLMAAMRSGALMGALYLASRRSVLGLGRLIPYAAGTFGHGRDIAAEGHFGCVIGWIGRKIRDQRADPVDGDVKPVRFHVAQDQRGEIVPVTGGKPNGNRHGKTH